MSQWGRSQPGSHSHSPVKGWQLRENKWNFLVNIKIEISVQHSMAVKGSFTVSEKEVFFSFWSLSLINVNTKLNYPWAHPKAMSLSYQYKRTIIVYFYWSRPTQGLIPVQYYAEMLTLVWGRDRDPLHNCPNRDGCLKTNLHPPFSIVHVTRTCALTVPPKFVRIAR